MKDKEFKAKNRDESYVKDSAPDIRLGRHGDLGGQTPQQSAQHRNRIYQSQQPTNENTAVISDAPYSAETENVPAAEQPHEQPQTEPHNSELHNSNTKIKIPILLLRVRKRRTASKMPIRLRNAVPTRTAEQTQK